MPVAIDSGNRPGSSTSIMPPNAGIVNMNAVANAANSGMMGGGVGGGGGMSSGGGGVGLLPIRPTTTSRRGGRSRSPVAVLGGRVPPTPTSSSNGGNGNTNGNGTVGSNTNSSSATNAAAGSSGSGGAGSPTSSTLPVTVGSGSGHNPQHPASATGSTAAVAAPSTAGDGDNPSSAAAAAAAAAKAYSRGGGGGNSGGSTPATTTWPPSHSQPLQQPPPPTPPPHADDGYASSAQQPPQHPHGRSPPPYDTATSKSNKLPPPTSYAPPPSNWPGGDAYRPGPPHPPPRGHYDPHRRGPPSSNFPPPRDEYGRYHDGPPPPHPPRYDDRYGPPPPPHRGMPLGGGHYPPPPPHHHHHPSEYHPHYHPSHRYGGAGSGGPNNSSSSRAGPPQPPHHHPQQGPPPPGPPPHRMSSHHRSSGGPGGGSSSSGRPLPPQAIYHPHHHPRDSASGPPLPLRGRDRPGMGTTLVLGGPTPIHLPKSPVVSSSSSSSKQRYGGGGSSVGHRDGTASSVFRGRPETSAAASASASASARDGNNSSPDPDDENSPQKILLSLRTPTTSFEELKDKSKKLKSSAGAAGATDASTPSTNSPQPQASPQVLFEPQRSGDGSKADGTIDIAPSFNLLQSFDSFGDTQYFNIDSSLNADSFGLAQTESLVGVAADAAAAAAAQVLRENHSGGNFSTQFLAPSGSGALTIGYSPVNSFGNNSVMASSSRRNSMMVVGGMDGRSASPTQALGIYRSYSGGTVRPLDDSHLRMSVGSFGGNSVLGYNNRSYGGAGDPASNSPPGGGYYMGPVRSHDGPSSDRMPHFYVLLRKFSAAFKDCTFLLPGVKSAIEDDAETDANDGAAADRNRDDATDKHMNGHDYPDGSGVYGEPGPQDIVVARRRVESSVCAFGGNLHRGREATKALQNREAIFRGMDGSGDKSSTTVTPSTTDTSSASQLARRRTKYEDELSSRYYENESRLSWEFEENPPVEIPSKDEAELESAESGQTSIKTDQDPLMKDDKGNSEDDQFCLSVNGDGDATSTDKGSTSPQAKMRYRCKLCGQPKQNHRCPYQQALARSIGTMVYPAVNAFTADEPGTIAAPLSEMNNFVDIQKDGLEPALVRPSPDRMRHMTVMSAGPMMPSAQVTPEAMRSNGRHSRSSGRHGNKKRMYSQMKSGSADQGDLLFVAAMELKPEQFRVVSTSKVRKSSDAYIYPALPLPYAQRKRLSDNLFSLSNEVPKLTDECAQVLREAREKDLWDLAVAELMTQVIVIIHCSDRDYRFEGLRQYLLTLGIAC